MAWFLVDLTADPIRYQISPRLFTFPNLSSQFAINRKLNNIYRFQDTRIFIRLNKTWKGGEIENEEGFFYSPVFTEWCYEEFRHNDNFFIKKLFNWRRYEFLIFIGWWASAIQDQNNRRKGSGTY